MSVDVATRAEVAKAWGGFKDKKDGDDGVANARSQNAFKFAQQAPASIASGASESLRGFAAAAPAGTPAAARLSQYTQQSRFVNGRAFFQNGNQWIDSNAQNTAKRQRIQFNSEDYFNLLTKHPEAGPCHRRRRLFRRKQGIWADVQRAARSAGVSARRPGLGSVRSRW